MTFDLKECPFCGGDAEIDTQRAYRAMSPRGIPPQTEIEMASLDMKIDTAEFAAHIETFRRTVVALAEIEGMKAENEHRTSCGQSVAYGEEAFSAVASRNGIA